MPERYFGKYTGVVKDNQDDQNLGQVKVSVPSIFPPDELMTARPALPYGHFFVPENEAKVWVEFEGGDPGLPIWTGLQYVSGEWPDEANANPPQYRVIKTACGHLMIFNDKSGEARIYIKDGVNGHEIILDQNGIQIKDGVNANQAVILNGQGIQVNDTNQNSLALTSSGATLSISSGAKVELTSSGVTVDTGQGAKLSLTAGMVTLECPSLVQIKGSPIMLGSSAALPVARLTDFGVGNLGAPVTITAVGNPMVLA